MGKISYQKNIFQPSAELWPSQLMEQFLLRPQSPASGNQDDLPEPTDPPTAAKGSSTGGLPTLLIEPTATVTVEVLDIKLHALLQELTHNITKEVGRIAHKLQGEITQLGNVLTPWKINLMN